MVSCCAVMCSSSSKKGHKMFRVPWDPERRKQWAAAIRRQTREGKLFMPTDHSRLCSDHFVKGSPSYDPDDVDYVPTLFFHDEASRERSRRIKNSHVRYEGVAAKRYPRVQASQPSQALSEDSSDDIVQLSTPFSRSLSSSRWLRNTKCCVRSCTNHTGLIQDGVLSFHRLPRNHNMKAKWIKAIGRKQWPSKWWTAICSDHFVSDDFSSGCLGQGMLKPTAIPSIHLDKSVMKVGKASRVTKKQLSRGARAMTTDTAGAAGSETSALESSSLSKTNSFVVVTLNPSMTPAATLATGCATSGDGSAPDEAVPAGSPTTSGEQPEKLTMMESSSENESTTILGVMGVAEEDGQQQKVAGDQPHSSKEPESDAPQVMEPRQQPEATELTAAMTEAHPVDGGLVTDSSTPSSLPEKVTTTMTPAKASQPAKTPTTPPNSQQRVMTRANKKTPDGQHPELASETSNVGTKLVIQPDEGACDVCQRTFKQEDLTKIFVELRKQTVEDSPGDQLCPFMLCPECKEPLLRAPTLDGSSSGMQRHDIVAKLHERALNTQPATQISDEPEAMDKSTPQPAEPPMSKRVQIELTRGKPTNEVSREERSDFLRADQLAVGIVLSNADAAVKCCVPTCTNRSDKSTNRPLSFHRFPRRIFLKKQWADAIGRTDWLPTTTSVICSDHFRPNDFVDDIRGSGNLKESAIPSVFGAAIATEGTSSDAGSPEVESVLYSNKGKAVVSLFQMKTPTKGRGSAETCTTSNNTRGATTKRTLSNGPSPSQVEKKKKKKLTVMDVMEVDTSSYWLKTLSNRSVNFVHIVHRPMPCITRSVTVSPDMSVMVAIENARLSLLPCGTPVPSTVVSIETLQELLDRVEMLDDTERIDNWQLRRQSTLKLVTVLLQEVCHNVGNADSQYGVLASIRDQVKDLL